MTTTENPPIKPDSDISPGCFQGTWWVIHTKPRQEKALARDLFRGGQQYFAPMYQATRRSKGRAWKTTLPLFPGYLFLCGTLEDRLIALKTNRIVRVLEVPNQARLAEELSAIDQLLLSGLAVSSRRSLNKGTLCRICSGPLAELQGRIERAKGKARFIVNVSILGQGAMVEIDADLLEPVT
jgi:transcriptional antiterminator RfaH